MSGDVLWERYPYPVWRYDTGASTNLILKEKALAGAPSGAVVMAREQSAGIGRLGRRFFSPRDGGLYFSYLLRVEHLADLSLLTSTTGLAVCRGIEQAAGVALRMKWPNDLLLQGKKVCGILVQLQNRPEGGMDYAMIGIGINLRRPPEGWPDWISGQAIALEEVLGAAVDPERILYSVLTALNLLLIAGGLSEQLNRLLAELRRRSATIGKRVTVQQAGVVREGTALDIATDGRLWVEFPEGKELLSSGELQSYGEELSTWNEKNP